MPMLVGLLGVGHSIPIFGSLYDCNYYEVWDPEPMVPTRHRTVAAELSTRSPRYVCITSKGTMHLQYGFPIFVYYVGIWEFVSHLCY